MYIIKYSYVYYYTFILKFIVVLLSLLYLIVTEYPQNGSENKDILLDCKSLSLQNKASTFMLTSLHKQLKVVFLFFGS